MIPLADALAQVGLGKPDESTHDRRADPGADQHRDAAERA
jgi:hypothetical protein